MLVKAFYPFVGETMSVQVMDSDSESNSTLYVNNISERVNKNTLKRSIHMLFERCGKVSHIRTGVGKAGKGQLWIRFESAEAAGAAMKELQGFDFSGKPLRIALAKKLHSIAS